MKFFYLLPILLYSDPEIMEAIEPWKGNIDEKGRQIVGKTNVPLLKYPCSNQECNLGNFVADALVDSYLRKNPWTEPIIGLVPFGAIRTALDAGSKQFFSQTVHFKPYLKKILWFFSRHQLHGFSNYYSI